MFIGKDPDSETISLFESIRSIVELVAENLVGDLISCDKEWCLASSCSFDLAGDEEPKFMLKSRREICHVVYLCLMN